MAEIFCAEILICHVIKQNNVQVVHFLESLKIFNNAFYRVSFLFCVKFIVIKWPVLMVKETPPHFQPICCSISIRNCSNMAG